MMNSIKLLGICLVVLLAAGSESAVVGPITFAPGDYDNTPSTVTGTNAAPVYNNNQTTGLFRDVFWWGTAYNGGTKGVGSPDFINSVQSNLISNGGTPARAVLGGDDYALNFTGVRTSGGASFLTVYDDLSVAGKNYFDASLPGGLQISADVLFTPGNHAASAGVVSLYNEGQDGLALLASNGGGNNPDVPKVSLVFQQSGAPTTLKSVSLSSGTFLGDTNGTIDQGATSGDHWYRVLMDLSVTGDTWSVEGYFYNHVDPWDPGSGLGSLITSLSWSGSISGLNLSNPGEVGLMAYTPENFSDGVAGTPENPLVDNIGVSITNFEIIPEPATMAILGLGGLLLLRKK